jgi:hypothetical protein
LHRVKVTHSHSPLGPKAHTAATLARSAGALPSLTGSQAPAGAGRRRRYGAREGKGRGPGGPQAHRGTAGEVGLAGGWPVAVESTMEARRSGEGIRDDGGDSKHLSPIPSTGRLQAATRTFSARRGGKGRSLAATGGDGHGLL